MKKFKQGQTVYTVNISVERHYEPVLVKYFLYSHKEPLPPEGCMISKMPVNMMNEFCERFPNDFITRSRRKAITRLLTLRRVRENEKR